MFEGFGLGCRVSGLEFRVSDFGLRVEGAGCKIEGVEFRVKGLGVWGYFLGVQGIGDLFEG